jgi:N-methylhydantoinase A
MAHSAYGALASDIQQSAERSLVLRAGGGTRDPWEGLDYESINAVFAELEERCTSAMEQSGFSRQESQLARTIDMRYRRQTHDLMVPVPDGPVTAAVARKLVELFEESYEAVGALLLRAAHLSWPDPFRPSTGFGWAFGTQMPAT